MSLTIEQWTTELRYKKYEEWSLDYIQGIEKLMIESKWKPTFHVHPRSGLLNDPNGFSYFNGQWHLFYQAFPFGPVHGVKSWAHLVSDDLVNWEYLDLALLPDSPTDCHGVYSGSAISIEDKLFIIYTGNVRNKKWERSSLQLGAWMDENNTINKVSKPLIDAPPKGYTQEFRDPQIIHYRNKYLMIIGAQNVADEGKVLVYQTDDVTKWEFLGELNFSNQEMGFMVECPNILFVDEQPVVLFCPQGLSLDVLAYQNIYPNTYVIGEKFNLETLTVEEPSKIQNLDEGFDVYATQGFNAPDGRVLIISWVGLPEIDYPSFSEEWAHCLSLVKELTLKDGKLYQFPVVEVKKLRQAQRIIHHKAQKMATKLIDVEENHYELEIVIANGTIGELIIGVSEKLSQGLSIHFDTFSGTIRLDRKKSGIPFAEEYGVERTASVTPNQPIKLSLFVDESICELFINEGERVITSRFFKTNNECDIYVSCEQEVMITGNFWQLKGTN